MTQAYGFIDEDLEHLRHADRGRKPRLGNSRVKSVRLDVRASA